MENYKICILNFLEKIHRFLKLNAEILSEHVIINQ